MLKTYRIIPLVFILFLFGFTFITVVPVFASEVAELNARIAELEAENATLVRADAQRGAPNPLPDCDRLIDWLDPFFACDR